MQELLQRLPQLNLLVVGDLLLDHYLWGDATRISPEAPVPVVKVERDSYTAGGAANVALNLRALGVSVTLAGAAGNDADGQRLREILAAAGILFDTALLLPDVQTIVKTRVMCRNQQLCRLDREQPSTHYALPDSWSDRHLEEAVARADAVILSDYAKGAITTRQIRRVQELAAGKLVALDPKPRSDLSFHGPDLLTPNRAEALMLAGIHGVGSAPFPAEEVCRRIHAAFAPRLLVVTLGADGMLISSGGRVRKQVPTAARAVFDVSGAGDTVIAALTAALAAGADPETAVHLANLAAGVVVAKVGTATATPEEILAHAAQS